MLASQMSDRINRSNSVLHRLAATLVMAAVTACLLAPTRRADADEKTQRIVSGVLQLLIDSQRPDRGRGRLASPPPKASREVQIVVDLLSGYRGEAERLAQTAQQDIARGPGLRPLIGDILTFHASTETVFHQARHMSHPSQIGGSVAQLDSTWRVLSWRLKQTRGISNPCRASVDALDQLSAKLCELYQLQPQVDYRSVQRQADSLTFYTRALVSDLELELRRSPRRHEIVHAASRAQQAAGAFAEQVAQQASYDNLVTSYQSFVSLWGPLARRVSSIQSRFVERNVLSIQEVDQNIHELLWLPRGIDRQLLAQMTNGILAEIDQIYGAVNLNVLIQLPNAHEVPSAASDFYGCCQHFADCVRRDEPEDELVDAYGYLPDAWVSFSRLFRTLDHPQIQQSLSEIEQRLVALREPLRIPGGFDRDALRDRAATLEHDAEHLTEDLDRWLRNERRFEKDRRDLVELGKQFQSAARTLHLAIVQNSPDVELQRLAEAVVAQWESLHARIEQCEAGDRDHIRELQAQISRDLIGIQAMFL